MKIHTHIFRFSASAALLAFCAASVLPQKIIDRIVARVQNDIILRSDLQELAEYQIFVDGKSETDQQLLERLIDQWIVRREAEAARFPQPSEAEIEGSLQKLKKSFATPRNYEERIERAGLTEPELRRIIASQLYLSGYLDSRFRPLIQVDQKAIREFYENRVVPRAKARGQAPPSLDAATDYIQEALIQQGINAQADRWLTETRARFHVEQFLDQGTK